MDDGMNARIEFAQALKELNEARAAADFHKQRLEELLVTPEIQLRREVLESAKFDVDGKDQKARELAVRLFSEFPELKKERGVEVVQRKFVNVIDYDGLRSYCLDHAHDLLDLNESKVAAFVLNVSKIDQAFMPGFMRFLEIITKPVVRIPTKLDKHLEDLS